MQEPSELEHIFNLMLGCTSYLEIGTAEGNSLYVLAHAMKPDSHITCVDFGEKHTRPHAQAVIGSLVMDGYDVRAIMGNSHDKDIIEQATDRQYDVVLIDAGHSYEDVMADARNYAPLAHKYVFFHDVQLPEVERAFKEYQLETGLRGYTVISSKTFGFGVISK